MSNNEFHTTDCSCARADRTSHTRRQERGGHPHRNGRALRPERRDHTPVAHHTPDAHRGPDAHHTPHAHRGPDAHRRRMMRMIRLQRTYERGFAAGYTQGQAAA